MIRVSNSLDPDVGPDLGPNCLQRFSPNFRISLVWIGSAGLSRVKNELVERWK